MISVTIPNLPIIEYLTNDELKRRVLYLSKNDNYKDSVYIKGDLGKDLLYFSRTGEGIGLVTRTTGREFYEAPAGTQILIKN